MIHHRFPLRRSRFFESAETKEDIQSGDESPHSKLKDRCLYQPIRSINTHTRRWLTNHKPRTRFVLFRREDTRFRTKLSQSGASGRCCEVGTVALAADVQEHELSQPIRFRLLEHFADQLAGLRVREMSFVTEDAANQPRRAATLLQEFRIVIELQREQFDIE